MLKAVPDTNIFVSALIGPDGNSAKICARVSDFVALNLKHYRDIQIVTPKAFLEILDQAKFLE